MSKLVDFQTFVNSQLSYNEKRLTKINKNSMTWSNCKRAVDGFKRLSDFIQKHPNCPEQNHVSQETLSNPVLPKLALTPADIDGLPEELIKQLAITDSDRADFDIIAIVDQLGGIATLDQIIIALYKKTNEIPDRAKMNAKMYRIVQKGLLTSVAGKKAVYASNGFNELIENGQVELDI